MHAEMSPQRTRIGILQGSFHLTSIMSAIGKQKHDKYENSQDKDEVTLGRQALPITNLPFDFDGVPQDGPQYLLL